jgi:hypothetical protein
MGLPSSITLNVGSPAADIIFSGAVVSGASVTYYAPSPQGDLEGRPSLRVSHETTKTGIVRSLVKIVVPIWDNTNKKYVGSWTKNDTLIRPAASAVQGGKDVLEMGAEFLTASSGAYRDIIAAGGI